MDPQSVQWSFGEKFQYHVLGLCLRDPTFLPKYIDVIKHTYFETETLANLAYLMLQSYKATSEVPHRDVMEFRIREHARTYDRDGSKKLEATLNFHLDNAYNRTVDEHFISTRIVKFGQRQALRLALMAAADDLESAKPADEKDDMAEKINRRVEEACQVGTSRDIGLVWHDVALDLPAILRNSVAFKNKVGTGLPTLDKILDGGPGGGELAVVMGPPNKGKSTFLCGIGAAAQYWLMRKAKKDGTKAKAVVHITCEMSKEMTAAKYAAAVSGMKIRDVKYAEGVEYSGKVAPQLDLQSPLVVKDFAPGTTTVEEVKWYLSHLLMTLNLDIGVLVLDYADRLKGGEDDRFRGMGAIYDGLIQIAKKFEIPVWTGTQVTRARSRDADDGVIGMDGAAESWKKAEASDIMLSLNQNDFEAMHNVMRISNAKIRDGEAKGVIMCRWDGARCLMREMTDEEKDQFSIIQSNNVAQNEMTGGNAGFLLNTSPVRKKEKKEKKAETSDAVPSAPPLDIETMDTGLGDDFWAT
jgi:replicative DNA helicase